MQELVAKSISHIFSPIVAWPIFLVIILWQQPPTLWVWAFIFEFVLPTVLLGLFMKWRLISDLEITQVRERRLFFCLLLVSHSISTVIMWDELRLVGLVLEIIGIAITFFWKISAHLAANGFVVAVIIATFGWQWWPLVLILPVIAWARVVRKKHTVMQTILGGTVPFVVVLLYEYLSH